MKAGKETELYNQGYMDGYDDAQKTHIEPIKPKIKDVKEKSFPKDVPDYWTRLEHQYAGMAMQGILSNKNLVEDISRYDMGLAEGVAKVSKEMAIALVKGFKSK